ncbi:hypothetical protein Tco_0917646 [Tanacetum coccineum]
MPSGIFQTPSVAVAENAGVPVAIDAVWDFLDATSLMVNARCLRHSGGGLILSQAYGNLYATTALGANGDVLEAFRGISEYLDEVRMEPGHEDTDF